MSFIYFLEEEIVINAIKSKKIKKEDLETITKILDMQPQSFTNLRIFIAEKKKLFVQSFKLQLMNSQLKKNVFSWIDTMFDSL